jgi:hypothetical protein
LDSKFTKTLSLMKPLVSLGLTHTESLVALVLSQPSSVATMYLLSTRGDRLPIPSLSDLWRTQL